MDPIEQIGKIAADDGRYSQEAFLFLFRALEHTVKAAAKSGTPGHVTGRELLGGIRRLGLDEFGFLARTVFESWGIRTTRDFGEMVFLLVDAGMMGKTETDSIDDFSDVYDFETVFEKEFRLGGEKK
jgi:uncharacterized repeat protein (TIGR04138 family)